ncbi:MAG: hypothetical protein UW38_C0001G0231 [Candidatus Saccharibacteria bacterium GW2011_GWC2_44_17]|nr:MAG: hypothetical protein UW38_C0001G0231 [Candidatus Saccharibacteria bacterium GW2011_GWC2_44_17]OGL23471.1 MAG: hypothetical protein A2791_01325 [Candidatus Saccharibacteria bacterium RIFCSPHIGHO2_01_FULL_46_30]
MIYGMNDDLHKQLEGSGDIEAKEHDVTARKWRRLFFISLIAFVVLVILVPEPSDIDASLVKKTIGVLLLVSICVAVFSGAMLLATAAKFGIQRGLTLPFTEQRKWFILWLVLILPPLVIGVTMWTQLLVVGATFIPSGIGLAALLYPVFLFTTPLYVLLFFVLFIWAARLNDKWFRKVWRITLAIIIIYVCIFALMLYLI